MKAKSLKSLLLAGTMAISMNSVAHAQATAGPGVPVLGAMGPNCNKVTINGIRIALPVNSMATSAQWTRLNLAAVTGQKVTVLYVSGEGLPCHDAEDTTFFQLYVIE